MQVDDSLDDGKTESRALPRALAAAKWFKQLGDFAGLKAFTVVLDGKRPARPSRYAYFGSSRRMLHRIFYQVAQSIRERGSACRHSFRFAGTERDFMAAIHNPRHHAFHRLLCHGLEIDWFEVGAFDCFKAGNRQELIDKP